MACPSRLTVMANAMKKALQLRHPESYLRAGSNADNESVTSACHLGHPQGRAQAVNAWPSAAMRRLSYCLLAPNAGRHASLQYPRDPTNPPPQSLAIPAQLQHIER